MALVISKSSAVKLHDDWWPEGEDIYILRKMPWGIKAEIDAAMFDVRVQAFRGDEGNRPIIDAKAEMAAGRKETLRQMIVRWTLKDDDGNEIPCTPENIDSLDQAVAQYVYDQIQLHNASLTDADQKNGNPGAVAPMRAPDAPLAN